MTTVLALDDGHPMQIPHAWQAWRRHDVQYWRLRVGGMVYANRVGTFTSYGYDHAHSRWVEAVVGEERDGD